MMKLLAEQTTLSHIGPYCIMFAWLKLLCLIWKRHIIVIQVSNIDITQLMKDPLVLPAVESFALLKQLMVSALTYNILNGQLVFVHSDYDLQFEEVIRNETKIWTTFCLSSLSLIPPPTHPPPGKSNPELTVLSLTPKQSNEHNHWH